MGRQRQIRFATLACAATGAMIPQSLRADPVNRYWVNNAPAGALWSDPANWSATANGAGGAGEPASDQYGVIVHNDNVDRSITLDHNATPGYLEISNRGGGTDTLIQSGAATLAIADFLLLGTGAGGRGAVEQSAGNYSCVYLDLAMDPGSFGSYRISGGSLTVTNGLPGGFVVGYGGNAVFNQTGGSVATGSFEPGSLYIGYHPGSSGAYNLSGASSSLSSKYDEFVGYNTYANPFDSGGFPVTATFTQSGGTNSVGRFLYVSSTPLTTGSYELTGGTLHVGVTEYVGYMETYFGTSTGSFTQSGGSHIVDTSLYVGANKGSGTVSGTYTLSGGSLQPQVLVVASNFNVRANVNGSFTHTGGTLAPYDFFMATGTYAGTIATYQLSGSGTITCQDAEVIGQTGTATFTQTGGSNSVVRAMFLGGAATSDANYTISGGTLSATSMYLDRGSEFHFEGGTIAPMALDITRGGVFKIGPTGGGTRTLTTMSLAITNLGKLDLGDNKVILNTPGAIGSWNGSVYTGVSGLIASGRGDGHWNGSVGIVTSQSAATNGILTSIGVATTAQAKGIAATATASWAGQTVTGSDTLVMYTYGGDANLDGKINVDDYGRIDSSIALGIAGWYNGDFNYDGKINVDDYGIIDSNIAVQGPPFSAADGGSVTAVPEPGVAMLVPTVAGVFASRTRRTRRPTR